MQLNLFDCIALGDTVQIMEVDRVRYAEIYYYRHYYCSQLIGKVGTVQVMNDESIGVRINDETLLFERPEVQHFIAH